MPYRPGFSIPQLGTEGSSTEDFRSVIDDLTVANKKLKRRLRKYEKIYDAHLDDEKLFEVKFHGLSEHKKKELEDTLRKFAANLDNSLDKPTTTPPNLHPQKTTSSLNSQFADSGYTSMSASGPNSNSINTAYGQSANRKMSKSQYSRQQQSIRSYLQDIPPGLLPTQNVHMSDKMKKKLVVRRLEQLFAGKHSIPGQHSQPLQQEEVAQSAAMADRIEKEEATGQSSRREGHREARIMHTRAADDDGSNLGHNDSLQKLRPHLASNEQGFFGSSSPDQRPTRPLDLDPYRAQVPAENMDYFRHLGFSPPDMECEEESPEQGHGWIYLNLLINMAQLHTLNVTQDFVKAAVTEYSSKFELSPQGRKVRWRGAYDMTRNSDSSSDHLGRTPPTSLQQGSPNAKPPYIRLNSGDSGDSGASSSNNLDREARRAARAEREKEHDKFSYKPIFLHKESSEEDDDYDFNPSSSNSPFMAQPRGDSSAFNSSSAMPSSSSRRRHRDGPMIFYNKAKFCTDLSGDRRGLSTVDPSTYNTFTSNLLGAALVANLSGPKSVCSIGEPKGPLDTTPMDIGPTEHESSAWSESDFEFSPTTLHNVSSDNSPDAMDFEVSGLGGVQPDDNFSIQVRRSQTMMEPRVWSHARKKRSQHYSKKILEALHGQNSSGESEDSPTPHQVIKEEILSASRKSLPSSELPPASLLPFDSTSSGDVDSDLESDVSSNVSSSSSSDQYRHPSPGPQNQIPSTFVRAKATSSADQSELEAGSDYNSEDESVDLLATARQQNPNAVRISEREYDAQFPDRLADEIPAGSSAATVGGGSGFNSPASKMWKVGNDVDNRARARHASGSGSASSQTKNLKRARTHDSIATLHAEKSQRQR